MIEKQISKLEKLKRDPNAVPTGGMRLARVFPLLLLLGFLALLAFVLGDRILPARDVTVGTVVTVPADTEESIPDMQDKNMTPIAQSQAAELLFQASGWIEPSPLPVIATTLVDGVIESVHVLEGDSVVRGQLLAKLVDADAKLDLATAESRRNALRAKIAVHGKKVAAAKARVAELADPVKRLGALSDSNVSDAEVEVANLRLATQVAEVATLEAQNLELEAELAAAETEINRSALALERTKIIAPMDGTILRLHAVPGLKRMLGMDDRDSATIAVLFDPANLQARIDIPLEDASRVAIGQPVRIRTNFLPDSTFQGTISKIAGEADLQRNTLQVKVRIENPDVRLRPNMLCRAEFFAGGNPDEAAAAHSAVTSGLSSSRGERVEIYAPESALIDSSGGIARVWKLNPDGSRILKSQVTLTSTVRDGYRLVSSGLQPGDQVVLNPSPDLREGERVRVIAKK